MQVLQVKFLTQEDKNRQNRNEDIKLVLIDGPINFLGTNG